MESEHGEDRRAGGKRYARTPRGTNLGERIYVNGEWVLRHKGPKKEYEDLSPESIAECISGRKVDHIVYMATDAELAAGK